LNKDEIYCLFKEIGLQKNIIEHVELVADISKEISELIILNNHILDINLVISGALLHDIGRSKTHGIKHAIIGVKILQDRGCKDLALMSIIERHIGAGITKEEALKLGLPIKDYTPITLEEKIVSAADNLTFGAKRITLKERLDYFNQKGLMEAAKKIAILHKELSLLTNIDLDDILCKVK